MMTNEEIHVLAAAGLRERIATMQAELAVYHETFPELFHGSTPPQLLNGHRPAVAAAPPANARSRSITFDVAAAPVKRRRKMSRKARAAISAAQKARWAKHKAKRRGANA